jgi:hypothetical protein
MWDGERLENANHQSDHIQLSVTCYVADYRGSNCNKDCLKRKESKIYPQMQRAQGQARDNRG